MKSTIRAFFAVTLLLGAAAGYTACSSDDSSGAGPQNGNDAGKDTGGGPGPGDDAGDGGPGTVQCNPVGFDNTRIPGWPAPPAP